MAPVCQRGTRARLIALARLRGQRVCPSISVVGMAGRARSTTRPPRVEPESPAGLLVRLRGLRPSLSPAEDRVAETRAGRPAGGGGADHQRAGRRRHDLRDDGAPVLQAAGAARLPPAPAGAGRGVAPSPGCAPALGERHQRRTTPSTTSSPRSPTPTPARSRRPPSSSTATPSPAAADAIAAASAGRPLRHRRERGRRRSTPAEAAPDRRAWRSRGTTRTSP